MPITFSGLASALAGSFKIGKAGYDWLTDAQLKKDFKAFLSELETRRVLYVEWRYEDMGAVHSSLGQILQKCRDLRAQHTNNPQVSQLLKSLITVIQKETDTMHGCNMHSRQGEFMAYRSLIKIRTEFARVLAIFCGMLNVDPASTELKKFIMDMAVVRPRA
jgi:hypothetical protein